MLGSIRDKATGWIAGVIVGALIISFAFWGVSFYFGGGGEANVVRVNDTDISMQTYQRAFFNLRRQMQSMFGDELSLEEEELIRQQTLQRLIDTEIINQIVRNNNFRVTDAQVASTIKNIEVFQGEQGFDRLKYEQSIASLGMEPALFEQQMRMDLLSEQLQAGLSETMFVTEGELKHVLKMRNQTRDITYAILSVDNLVDTIEVNDADIEAYYEKNKNNYQEAEKVKIAYIDLNVEKLSENIEVTEDLLRDYYENNRDNYDVAEQRSVTKLFVKIDEESTEEDKAEASVVMEKALQLVEEGNSFEQVVEQFTEEGKGALEFSEHAFMTRGVMGDEIDEFLFSNDEDAVSNIIETESGLNIVRVGEIRGGPKNRFENVAEQVENDYKVEQAELQYFELSDQLTTLAYEHPDTLEIAAEEIGQALEVSDFFSRNNNNDDITSNDRIIQASFDQEAIDSGINSDAIDLGENHIAVIRVLEHQPARVKPLDDVRESVISDIKEARAADKLKELGESIIAQLRDGVVPEDIEAGFEINWFDEQAVKRDAVNVNRSVLRTAFQIAVPDNANAVDGYSMGSGDYAVVMVSNVEEGDVEEVAETTSDATNTELLRIRGSAEWREFLDNARENARVKIFEENI